MAMILHPGIGERFSYNRRKWQIIDLKEGVYVCKTVDKKTEEIKTFSKVEVIKFCK